MSDAAAEFFQAVIDDHRRRPRNRGPLPEAHRVAKLENPACGDLCTIHLRLDPAPDVLASPAALAARTRIAAAAFTGAGCALSQASASLATAALAGRTVEEARALADLVGQLVRTGAAPDPAPAGLGDLAALAATHAFPARHACALLAWHATLAALDAPAG